MILLGALAIAVLAVASYEMWRRRAAEPRERLDADPPPRLLGESGADGGDGADGDGGD